VTSLSGTKAHDEEEIHTSAGEFRQMKILYIQQHFATNKGEAGVRGYNLVKVMTERGHDVTVLCGHNWRDSSLRPGQGKWFFRSNLDGFRIIQVAVTYSNKQSFIARIWSFLQFALLSCIQVWRSDADLVFASSTPLTVVIGATGPKVSS